MILQALNRYYEILVDDSAIGIAPFGYSTVGVSFALNLAPDGALLDVFPLFIQEQRGKKTVELPRPMAVPEAVKRTVKVDPNFTWDNVTYVLGISDQEATKPKYGRERFEAFRQHNCDLLAGADSDAARAVVAFLNQHDPSSARSHPAIAGHLDTLLKGGNLVFLVDGVYAHDDPAVRGVWADYCARQGGMEMQCLVTGKMASPARLHPSLKLRGGQPTGATLVGLNQAQ